MSISERIVLACDVARLIYRRRLYRTSPLLRNPLRLYRFLSANPSKNTHPIALQIEITSRCNLSCRYCIHHKMVENNKLIGDMPLERFVEILDRHKSTVQLVHIQGQGEPFLHPQFPEMVAECKRRKLLLLAFSNGTYWNRENRRMILESGFDLLYLSFDLQSKEKMEDARRGMDYDEVVHNFQSMVRERDAGRYPTVLALHSVIYRSELPNYHSRLIEIDRLIKPDIIVPTALAMPGADEMDYSQWYGRAGLDKERVFELPRMISWSKATHALCISNRDFYSRKGCRTCSKANFVYYRWDGSTSFCGERHTVDCDDPVRSVRKAVDLMKQGVVPQECRLWQYLPPDLFRKTLEENQAELV